MPTLSPAPDALTAVPPEAVPAARRARIESIDGLRGLVMLLMLVDHTREFFYIGHQVGDPMDLSTTPPALFFTRLAAHLCAPVFVALTGIAAWLYGRGRPVGMTAAFLLKRGLFLIALELTLVNFAWTFAVPPTIVFLQVIWAIGLSMVALAALVHLPAAAIAAVGAAIVAGHNLLDPVTVAPGGIGHAAWAVLHERGYVELGAGIRARTSYPVLPWIGVIALGYAAGPLFADRVGSGIRRRRLLSTGIGLLAGFAAIRGLNGYGDTAPWAVMPTARGTLMAFLNVTKYPPSLDFLLLTLGIGSLILAAWEGRRGGPLATLGGAPLFFYLLHLYILHLAALAWHAARGGAVDVASPVWVWIIAAALAPPLWLATRWFAGVKRRSTAWWLRYL